MGHTWRSTTHDGPLPSYSPVVAPETVVTATIPGDPVAKGRPRFDRRGRAYTPAKTRSAEETVGLLVKVARRERDVDGDSRFCVHVDFHCRTRRRTDLDNLTKLVLDAVNGVVWRDDAQVSEIHSRVFRGDPDPRTVLIIHRTDDGDPKR